MVIRSTHKHCATQASHTDYIIEVAASQGGASPAYAIEGAHQWMAEQSVTLHCIRLRPEVSNALRMQNGVMS